MSQKLSPDLARRIHEASLPDHLSHCVMLGLVSFGTAAVVSFTPLMPLLVGGVVVGSGLGAYFTHLAAKDVKEMWELRKKHKAEGPKAP